MQYQNIVMQCFVSVNDAEDGETVEIQAEDDGTLLVENIEIQFPNVYGLRYKLIFDKNFGQNVKIPIPDRPPPSPRDNIDGCITRAWIRLYRRSKPIP